MDEVRGPFAARLAALFPGRGARPARAEVEASTAKYREFNEAVRPRYFPGAGRSSTRTSPPIPRREDNRDVTAADMATVAARLHTASVAESAAASRPRSPSATRGCTGRGTSRTRRGAARFAARCAGVPITPRRTARWRVPAPPRPARTRQSRRAPAAAVSPESREYWHFLGILLRLRAGDLAVAAEAQARRSRSTPATTAPGTSSTRCWPAGGRRSTHRDATERRERRTDHGVIRRHLDRTDPTSRRLARSGFSCRPLRIPPALAAGSRIEAPTSIALAGAAGCLHRRRRLLQPRAGRLNNARIGRYCSVASGVTIGAHEHPTDWLTTSRICVLSARSTAGIEIVAGDARPTAHAPQAAFPDSCPITTLGPDVWIGNGAFVKAGVTIGAGAIVGARATVLRDVPPYAIVVGTPAACCACAFPRPIVERLLQIDWWRYSIYDLFEAPFDSSRRARRDRGRDRRGPGAALYGRVRTERIWRTPGRCLPDSPLRGPADRQRTRSRSGPMRHRAPSRTSTRLSQKACVYGVEVRAGAVVSISDG